MRALLVAVALLLAAAGGGCTFSSVVAYRQAGPPRDPARVRVLSAPAPGRPYEVVGLVVAQVDSSDPQELLDEVRRLGAALGADAVVDLRLRIGFGVFNVGHHVSGTAVRYR